MRRIKKIKLTPSEKKIEEAALKGEYQSIGKAEFEAIAQALEARKKDAVLNIRVNSNDLANIKLKAEKLGVRYQTFISELLHRVAQS